ncbi:hypothetical protein GCM10012275_12980 [Longimycelium tulufanense]|uniref:DUF397 domain-containing protein n=1 Tax=Longimycelium tulufanense TaxID=907463 RepID=A0A8J3FTS1_9PSEU|nr:DUF397 domain-containing protein [Longimycelium tulufanense]GGM43431.1 hypothetical protein GCM10012275_12980 [Longimycelium tulufanense]
MEWRKSSRSSELQNCVEVAALSRGVALRDSKDPAGPVLAFGRDAFSSFLSQVKNGTLDLD